MAVDLSLFNQGSFRFRNDDGSETTATWRQALNTNDSWRVTTGLRIRFTMIEQGGGQSTSKTFTLYYSKNAGAYTAVGASTPIQFSLSSNFANNDNTTQQISSGGTYVATNLGMQETTGGITNTVPVSNQFEAEWCLIIDAAQVSNGDTFDLRVYKTSSPVNTYTQTPRITVSTTIAKFAATTTWVCPTGVTSLTTVECWGASGGSGSGTAGLAGGGSGGGAYSGTPSYAVTPGNSYTVTVGTGGAAGVSGGSGSSASGDTWFDSTSGVLAKPGGRGLGSGFGAGTGGASGSGVGTNKYSGGNGAVGSGGAGGGGGGSAGSTGAGGNASGATGGTAGSGTGGGAGGTGASSGSNNATVGSPNGAGSGAGDETVSIGKVGADGAVWLTYSNPAGAGKVFGTALLNGIGTGGPFFINPLG